VILRVSRHAGAGNAFEYPTSLDAPVFSPPTALPFVVMVADRLARFSAAVVRRRAAVPRCEPSARDLARIPPLLDAFLFTAPPRPATSGLAAIRAHLWDLRADGPAAYARVRVTVGDRMRIGVADEQGRVLVLVPWPLLERLAPRLAAGQRTAAAVRADLAGDARRVVRPDFPRRSNPTQCCRAAVERAAGTDKGCLEQTGFARRSGRRRPARRS